MLFIEGDVGSMTEPRSISALEKADCLVVVGHPAYFYRLSETLHEREHRLDIHCLVIDAPPLMPAMERLFRERFRCGPRVALPDPDGGFLALSDDDPSQLRLLRPGAAWTIADRFGQALPQESSGELALQAEDGTLRGKGVFCSRRNSQTLKNEPLSRLSDAGPPPARIYFPDGERISIYELNKIFNTFPILAYRFTRTDDGVRLNIAPSQKEDWEQTRDHIAKVMHERFDKVEIVREDPGLFFPGQTFASEAKTEPGEVFVFWTEDASHSATVDALRVVIEDTIDISRENVRIGICHEPAEKDQAILASIASAIGDLDASPLPAQSCETGKLSILLADPGDEKPIAETAYNLFISYISGESSPDGLLLASRDFGSLQEIIAAFQEGQSIHGESDIVLYGIQPEISRRPVAVRAKAIGSDPCPVFFEKSRCDGCGDCIAACPADCIRIEGKRVDIDQGICIRCHLCCEHCPNGALRPFANEAACLSGIGLRNFVSRLGDRHKNSGELSPAPKWQKHRKPSTRTKGKAIVILGVSAVTMMEHAAALLVDGELVAAVEEERLSRIKHHRWESPDRPGAGLASEPALLLEEPLPTRSIASVLAIAGLSWDDVDAVALNGMIFRLRHSFSRYDTGLPPKIMRSNDVFFVPHHLAHAACALGLSGYGETAILSIDGRGDRETAAFYKASGDTMECIYDIPFFPDRSFGGVYETITRILGFGTHGQGSLMALAAYGEPTFDFSDCLSCDEDGVAIVSEWRTDRRFDPFKRDHGRPLTKDHRDIAASAQLALEDAALKLLRRGFKEYRFDRLCISGGVALNCRMNGRIRRELGLTEMFAPPGANDAGTAIGAALIAHRELTGQLPRIPMKHSFLGPGYTDEDIERWLKKSGLAYRRMDDLAEETAQILAEGRIICWHQGRMEFGPRALGARSILADPRRIELKDRLNKMKSRETWRPFGPSVLADHQGDWFEEDWDSPFMLFAVDVRPERREQVPVIVHADGSTRPQVVHPEASPRYAAVIEAFFRMTGIPMIVNTSFNLGGEPIVNTPSEAFRSFVKMGADALVLGNCLIRREDLVRR